MDAGVRTNRQVNCSVMLTLRRVFGLPRLSGPALLQCMVGLAPALDAQDEEVREDVDDIGRPEPPIDADRQAFPGELVDHVQRDCPRFCVPGP